MLHPQHQPSSSALGTNSIVHTCIIMKPRESRLPIVNDEINNPRELNPAVELDGTHEGRGGGDEISNVIENLAGCTCIDDVEISH